MGTIFGVFGMTQLDFEPWSHSPRGTLYHKATELERLKILFLTPILFALSIINCNPSQ